MIWRWLVLAAPEPAPDGRLLKIAWNWSAKRCSNCRRLIEASWSCGITGSEIREIADVLDIRRAP
jgi:hypothetical protein